MSARFVLVDIHADFPGAEVGSDGNDPAKLLRGEGEINIECALPEVESKRHHGVENPPWPGSSPAAGKALPHKNQNPGRARPCCISADRFAARRGRLPHKTAKATQAGMPVLLKLCFFAFRT